MPKPRALPFSIHSQAWYATPVPDPDSIRVDVIYGVEWKKVGQYLYYAGTPGVLMLDCIDINYGVESVAIEWIKGERAGLFLPRLKTAEPDWKTNIGHRRLAEYLVEINQTSEYSPKVVAGHLIELGLKDDTKRVMK